MPAMPLPLHILWLLVLTYLGAREQAQFSKRPRPAIIHVPPNQALFGLLAIFGIPSLVATTLFFPSWTLLYITSPEMFIPTGWSLLLGLGVTVSSGALLWLNYRWAKGLWERSQLLAGIPCIMWGALTLGGLLLHPQRFTQLGTYNEYWSKRAVSLFDHPYFWIQGSLTLIATFAVLKLWSRLKVQATG